jgi:predicted Zn-dependent protease
VISLIPWRFVFDLVRARVERGSLESAIRLARRYTKLAARSPHAWVVLDYALNQADVPLDQQESELRIGFERTRGDATVGILLMRVLFFQEKNAEGKRLLEELAHSHPESPDVWANLATVAISQSDLNRAGEYVERALAATTRSTGVDELLGIYVPLVQLGETARAIELLDELVARKPAHAGPYVILAQLVRNRDPERARTLLADAQYLWSNRPGFDEWAESIRIPERFLEG